jgi:hypothetical protein
MRLRRTGDAATTKRPGRKPKPGGKASCPFRAENEKLWAELRHRVDEDMRERCAWPTLHCWLRM